MSAETRFRITPRMVLGLFVILAGVVFTLDNLGRLHAEDWLRYWPVILIAVGVAKVFERSTGGAKLWGGLWIVAGAWLLLYELEITDFDPLQLWPLLLVLVGLSLIFGAFRPGRRRLAGDSSSAVSALALMSGNVRSSNSETFRGGDLTALMGGVELDLTQAELAPEGAVIDTLAIWGGVEIVVPPSWSVVGKVLPIMGAFEDNTHQPEAADGPRLTIKGFAIMGGVEVKNPPPA